MILLLTLSKKSIRIATGVAVLRCARLLGGGDSVRGKAVASLPQSKVGFSVAGRLERGFRSGDWRRRRLISVTHSRTLGCDRRHFAELGWWSGGVGWRYCDSNSSEDRALALSDASTSVEACAKFRGSRRIGLRGPCIRFGKKLNRSGGTYVYEPAEALRWALRGRVDCRYCLRCCGLGAKIRAFTNHRRLWRNSP